MNNTQQDPAHYVFRSKIDSVGPFSALVKAVCLSEASFLSFWK